MLLGGIAASHPRSTGVTVVGARLCLCAAVATVDEGCVFPQYCCSVMNAFVVPKHNLTKSWFLSEFLGEFRLVHLANIALNASQADSCSWTCIPNSRKKVPVALVLPCGLHGTSMPTCGPSLLRACHGPCASCKVVSLKGALEGCIINRSLSTAWCQWGAQTSTGHMLESCFCTLW